MIRIVCHNCDEMLSYPDDAAGVPMKCKACGKKNPLPEAGTNDWPEVDEPGPVISGGDVWGTVKLFVVIAAFIGMALMIFAAVYKIRNPTQLSPEQVQAERIRNEKVRDAAETTGDSVAETIFVALLVFLLVAYVFVFFGMGAWIGRDASRRGMNVLGWTSFYYVFQIFNRTIVGAALFVATGILTLKLGKSAVTLLTLGAEPLNWTGLYVYLWVRRRGILVPCDFCAQLRVKRLPKCPHCEYPSEPFPEPVKKSD